MKFLPFLLLCSCASTTATGRFVNVQSNCSYLEWHGGPHPSLIMKDVNNSTPTRAGGSFMGTTTAGLAGIITAWLTKGVVK